MSDVETIQDGRGRNHRRRRVLAVCVALFIVVFFVHKRSRVVGSGGDTVWFVPAAESLLLEGDLDLDEYATILETHPGWRYGVTSVDGHLYTVFPAAVVMVALPFVALVHATGLEDRILDEVSTKGAPGLEETVGSAVVASTAVVLLLLAWAEYGRRLGLAAAAIFAFGTPAWSTASRALWQHGPSMLAVAVVLVLLHRLEDRRTGALPLGVAVAAAFAIRPTNAVVVLAVTAFVVLRHTRELPRYLAGAALVAAPFVLHSLAVWGALLPPYFAPGRVAHAGTFAEALAGNLVSPARGLLVYSPILVLAPLGVVLAMRRGTRRPLVVLAVGIVVAHWLVISSFPHWWGGWCYGPRLFTDMTPLLVWLLLPVLDALRGLPRPWRSSAVAAVGLLAAVSVVMHFRGVADGDTGDWNALPVSVDDAPDRLWDWSDPPFLR